MMENKTKEQLEEFIQDIVTALADIEECDDAAYLNEGINDVITMIEKFKFEKDETEQEEHADCECEHVVESQFFQDRGCCRYCFFSSETDEMAQVHREIIDLIGMGDAPQLDVNKVRAIANGWERVEPSPKVFVVRKWVDDTASIVDRKIKNYRAFIGSELKKAIDWSIVLADKGQITPFVRR
jgi:hypothetical protein